ncbi:MAG: cupin domain-containing protein [Bacteroidia bacterium]|nr:cupin domain-containing protein [Bacteroidia bacterium]
MKQASLSNNLVFNSEHPVVTKLMETSNSREIRIALAKGQTMKEHKAPFPIVVHVVDGDIRFGVNGEVIGLTSGDIISLEANVLHDLVGLRDSIIRLTLSKSDTAQRVHAASQK